MRGDAARSQHCLDNLRCAFGENLPSAFDPLEPGSKLHSVDPISTERHVELYRAPLIGVCRGPGFGRSCGADGGLTRSFSLPGNGD